MNGLLAVSVNGLYCSTRVRGINPAPLQQNQTLPMKKHLHSHFYLDDNSQLTLSCGSVIASDSSAETISIYAGVDAIDDAIDKYLPLCDRSTQERFMQTLTDHIRKVDSIEA